MPRNLLEIFFCLYFVVAIACGVGSSNYTKADTPENYTIPESLLIQMKDIRNVSEFLHHFVVPEETEWDSDGFRIQSSSPTGNRTRTGLSAAAAAYTVAQFAGCQPENQVVQLKDPQDSGVFMWPPCVRLRRCGGCCTSKMLTCRPIKTSQISITVLKVRYDGPQSNAFKNDGVEDLTMEQHDRCSCGCKEQAEHCSEQQEYKANECRCVCTNQHEAQACNGPDRIWDSRDCVCLCRTTKECSTGFYFNIGSCRCEALRVSLISRWSFMLADVEGNVTNKASDSFESHSPANA